jgi:hypothetical protein
VDVALKLILEECDPPILPEHLIEVITGTLHVSNVSKPDFANLNSQD